MKSIHFFYSTQFPPAVFWAGVLKTWLKKVHPKIKYDPKKPDLVIVLGGDGTILEAARTFQAVGSHILGFNLGTFGFLAATSDTRLFQPTLKKVLAGSFQVVERMMIQAVVKRAGKTVFKTSALNEIVVTSPLSIVELEVKIDSHPYQYVRGTGLLVATATGSTAYNLSAHGPIVTPDIKCLILTEILDHNMPTPPLVVEPSRIITVGISGFRRQGLIKLAKSQLDADVVLVADGSTVAPLVEGDEITIKRSPKHSNFVVTDPNYFFKSLQDKFALK